MIRIPRIILFFFFNDTATTEIYTLSLHDALPISVITSTHKKPCASVWSIRSCQRIKDRKSTRLNSSHDQISYAVFCLKKKKNQEQSLPSVPECDRPPVRLDDIRVCWSEHILVLLS